MKLLHTSKEIGLATRATKQKNEGRLVITFERRNVGLEIYKFQNSQTRGAPISWAVRGLNRNKLQKINGDVE